MPVVLWARHGENVANLSATLSHRVYDGDLTEAGREQAERLAEVLGTRVTRLACSPLRRAGQTAAILAARLGLPPAAVLDDLRELNVGALDGRSDAEAWRTYRGVLAAWRSGRPEARFPGGEDHGELIARLWRALAAVTADPAGGRPLIVAHGASLRAALPRLTGGPEPGTDLPTGAIAALDVDPGGTPPGSVRLLSWPS